MSAPLVPVTLAFLSGIVLCRLGASPALAVVLGLSSAAIGWRRPAARRWSGPALVGLWVCLGALRLAVWQVHPEHQLQAWVPDDPQPVRLHGVVLDDPLDLFAPWRASGEGSDEPRQASRQVCVLAVRHLRTDERWVAVPGRVRVTLTNPRTPVAYGDALLVEGTWTRPPEPGNPFQYDWREALARRRVHGVVRVRPSDGVAIVGRRGSTGLAGLWRLRDRGERTIREALGDHAPVPLALLLGHRVALPEELRAGFVETGTVHLLVISGFHVGIIALLLELVLRLLGVPWRVRAGMVGAALGGYAILTGLKAPVVRATLMGWVLLGASARGRAVSWSNTLAAAALAMLWWDPTQLFDPGFQLSFGAVVSLLVFTPRWRTWLAPRVRWIVPGWVGRSLAVSVCATTAIWVGLAPALAWYFQLVSPVSMVANLLIAPLVSALVVAGTALLSLSVLVEPAMRWGAGVLVGLVQATLACVAWCRAVPGGHWSVGQPAAWGVAGYYALVGITLARGRLRWTIGRVLILWTAGLSLWLWSGVAREALASRWLSVDVLDVGHGDSLVVRTPRGHTLLVDAGTEEAGRTRVVPYLRAAGVRSLEALVVTHLDADHLGGAIPVLREFPVKRLLTNGTEDDTMTFRRVMTLARRRGVTHRVLHAGMRVGEGIGARIDVLHPPAGLVPGTEPGGNENSIVLALSKGTVRILLTGDIEEAGLPWLLRWGDRLAADVLKVPHHGSALGAAGREFFRTVHPEWAILSVGRSHHLPSDETLELLIQHAGRTLTTRDHGAIGLRTDGRRLLVTTGIRSNSGQALMTHETQVKSPCPDLTR